MSLGARATKGGARPSGKEGKHAQDKGKGAEKTQPKEKAKPQATTEQIRMACMIDRKSDDTSDVRRMVLDLMEMTRRPEEEVCSALHDADNDMQAACDLLLEESHRIQGEWRTNEKKKKKPTPPVGNGDVEPREQRARSGPRTRRGDPEADGRGRGGARGGRGGGGARGGRGGARGGRRPPRTEGGPRSGGGGMTSGGDSFPTTEDWDNEEWSGSLTDTKIFTSSVSNQPPVESDPSAVNVQSEEWDVPEPNNGPSSPHIPSYTYHNTNHTAPPAPSSPAKEEPYLPPPAVTHQPMGMSGSLSAAQSQYLSQLTQQTQRHENSVYTSNYGVYGSTDITSQRKPQRARVPPPSKIPMSAVEMPGGGDSSFLDVQFGAVDNDLPDDKPSPLVTSQPETQPVPAHEPPAETNSYPNATSMLSESLSVESAPNSHPPAEPPATTAAVSLEKQLTSSMKQMTVSSPPTAHTYQHRPKPPATVSAPPPYSHPAAPHLPPVYAGNVYAPQQVNSSSNASGAGGPSLSYGAPAVSLSQYQPIINSYQTVSSGGGYGGAALYTAAPYSPYQPPHNKAKEQQYDSSVASSNSLTNTTTQSSTAKVTTTTVSSTSSSLSTAYAVQASPALYSQQAGQYAYDDQCLRGTMPHHLGGYYEVGYGVGGARDASFGLGAGERFGRADAASPQQVPAALPPGYAYFYQPPPTTYQYGVYPQYGSSNSVGGVGSGAKVSSYTAPQPPYDAQDNYKQGGAAYGAGSKSAAAANSADLSTAMYAKAHVQLNKVNSYDKAAFHSGTPPPFGAGSHHLYIPAPPHHHHHPLPPHQMDVRMNSSQNRRESGSNATSGARGAAKAAGAKTAAYSQSYWPSN